MIDPESLSIATTEARALGRSNAENYQGQKPYPHVCLDDFLPAEILDRVLSELRELPEAEGIYNRSQEKLKTSYLPERLPLYTRRLFYALNSRPFILFLEDLTGIKGLIPDPYFAGGGIHLVANGGHLNIHADFNHHEKLNLERRLNVLIYLNRNWKEEYGGSFEIWNHDMKARAKSIVPLFNRMVCFSTGSATWHGNPVAVNHPEAQPRLSMAVYYYTATWNSSRHSHTTLFKRRPGTADNPDRIETRHALMKDLFPPILYRWLGPRLRRIGI
jgi:Rps23 Pro-64 3,4-dihydroxylase Tpa1-like proline 4-hydroxylase